MSIKEICRGRWGAVVFAALNDGTSPGEDFFSGLDVRDQTKLLALFRLFADTGKIMNREKFKKISSDLFEFKSFQIRMFCFIESGRVVITHGAIKKRDDLNKSDIQRAERIRIECKESNTPPTSKPPQKRKQ